jgi:hypothetical protein
VQTLATTAMSAIYSGGHQFPIEAPAAAVAAPAGSTPVVHAVLSVKHKGVNKSATLVRNNLDHAAPVQDLTLSS